MTHFPATQPEKTRGVEATTAERLVWLVAGGSLAAYSLSRKSLRAAPLAAVGGYVMYRGLRARRPWYAAFELHRTADGFLAQRTITVNRPAGELYRFCRNLANLPLLIRQLPSEHSRSPRSRWVVSPPTRTQEELKLRITESRENERLAWESMPGSELRHRGSISFTPAPGGRGTEVSVVLEYQPPGGAVGAALAVLLGREPGQQLREDLRQFKQLMEAGEIATVEGQPAGRRSKTFGFRQSLTPKASQRHATAERLRSAEPARRVS